MKEEYILRSMLLNSIVIHIFVSLKAKGHGHRVKVPNFISMLFGNPIGKGAMPEFPLLFGSANLISLIFGLLFFFFIGRRMGGTIYGYMWISLILLSTMYDLIKYKD